MKKRTMVILLSSVFAVTLFGAGAWAAASVYNGGVKPTALKVDLLETPTGVDKDSLSFSWAMNSRKRNEKQTAYRIVVAQGKDKMQKKEYVADTGWVGSEGNVGVKIDDLGGVLQDNSLYYWAVATQDREGKKSALSEAQAFSTSIGDEWSATEGIWAATDGKSKAADDFAFLRGEFHLPKEKYKALDRAVLSATARSPEPSRQYVYTLSVNGVCAGVGPSRYGTDLQGNTLYYYQSYDVTESLQAGENAVGAICYTMQDKAFLCQMTAYYKDGTSEILLNSARDADKWQSLAADGVFRKSNSIGTDYYVAHANNIDATRYPFGFDDPSFDAEGWNPVFKGGSIGEGGILTPSMRDNVGRYYTASEAVRITEKGDSVIVDLGVEIVGGFRLFVRSPFECEIELRFGEQLNADGSVKYKMLTGNEYVERWKLKSGEQTIETIDLMTYRYVEIVNCPVTVRKEMVAGVEIRTAWDENEYFFDSDSPLLNDIYSLVCHTAKVTSQDLYVDSQSRERRAYEGDCVINMPLSYAFSDNYSVARASAEYLYTNRTWPAEYVLFCSKMALSDYMTTGDVSSLEKYYDLLKGKTFTRYLNAQQNLLTNGGVTLSSQTDCILVDWPQEERDGYDMNVTYNTVFNAIAHSSYEELSKIAEATGHARDAAEFSALAARVRSSMIEKLYNAQTGAFSDGCSAAGTPSSHYSQHATAFALACGVYEGKEMADKMAAFIDSQGEIRTSVYGAYFLLEGLYASGNGDIANRLLLSEDTEEGARTWAYMLYGLGATVTSEAWNAQTKDNMTLSHPWGAAPAAAITQGIFGIRPTSPGYATFDIRFDTGALNRAQLTMPTVRGKIGAAFEKKDGAFTAEVSVPVNTQATIYLPSDGATILVNGKKTEGTYKDGFVAVTLGSGKWKLKA